MFTLDSLFAVKELAPLKKLYEKDRNDIRLVVVSYANVVNITETIELHLWLERFSYSFIPDNWVDANGETVDVVHIRNLTLQTQRAHPFKLNQPLPPNSWINQLDTIRFDILLYALVKGEISRNPTERELIELKNQLTSSKLDEFWNKMVGDVTYAQSGVAPKNNNQQMIVSMWRIAEHNRFFVPQKEQNEPEPSYTSPTVENSSAVKITVFNWNHNNEIKFRNWLALNSVSTLKRICEDTFGSSSNINMQVEPINIAANMIREAKRRNMLNVLASMAEYTQETSVDTGGGSYVNGNVNVGGNFVGRDLYH